MFVSNKGFLKFFYILPLGSPLIINVSGNSVPSATIHSTILESMVENGLVYIKIQNKYESVEWIVAS